MGGYRRQWLQMLQVEQGQDTGSVLVFIAHLYSAGMFFFFFLLPYTELGPFRALKVQSKLVRLGGGGGGVCSLKTVN